MGNLSSTKRSATHSLCSLAPLGVSSISRKPKEDSSVATDMKEPSEAGPRDTVGLGVTVCPLCSDVEKYWSISDARSMSRKGTEGADLAFAACRPASNKSRCSMSSCSMCKSCSRADRRFCSVSTSVACSTLRCTCGWRGGETGAREHGIGRDSE